MNVSWRDAVRRLEVYIDICMSAVAEIVLPFGRCDRRANPAFQPDLVTQRLKYIRSV